VPDPVVAVLALALQPRRGVLLDDAMVTAQQKVNEQLAKDAKASEKRGARSCSPPLLMGSIAGVGLGLATARSVTWGGRRRTCASGSPRSPPRSCAHRRGLDDLVQRFRLTA
jgi:hypothetical protein